MRKALVTRFYCDHCNKGLSKAKPMAAHEAMCMMNPLRTCWLCEAPNYGLMDEQIEYLKDGGDLDTVEEALGCPSCTLAVLMQSRINDEYSREERVHYDYKAKSAAYQEAKFAKDSPELYAFLYGKDKAV